MSPEAASWRRGHCEDVTVTIDSTDLEHGVHESVLHFAAKNDPYLATVDVPVTLTVNYKPVADAGTPQVPGVHGEQRCQPQRSTARARATRTSIRSPGPGAPRASRSTTRPAPRPPGSSRWARRRPRSSSTTATKTPIPLRSGVTVNDTMAPTIACPTSATVECQSNLQAIVSIAPATAADVCGGVTITNTHNAGGADASGSYPLGTTNVTFTATDGSGHSASCQISVTVVDTIAPTLTVTSTRTSSGRRTTAWST